MSECNTSDEIRSKVANMKSGHPRLLPYNQLETALATPSGAALAAAFVGEARKLLGTPTAVYELDGIRLRTGNIENVILWSTFAYRVTGEEIFLRRAEREMLAVAGFESWHPEHFLDTATLMWSLAIGYDWLYCDLTPEARAGINAGLLRHNYSEVLLKEKPFWLMGYNNWTQVCRCGFLFSALAADGRDEETTADLVGAALDDLKKIMEKFYSPDGTYPEGPGYWVYGTDHNALLIALLEEVFGEDFGLCSAAGFDRTLNYIDAMCGAGDYSYTYADSDSRRTLFSFSYVWLAARFGAGNMLTHDFASAAGNIASGEYSFSEIRCPQLMPFALLWWPDFPAKFPARSTHYCSGECETPVAMHRNKSFYLGIKGGSPSGSHGHMDGGSFIFESGGVRFIDDPGSEKYSRIESSEVKLWDFSENSSRWTLFMVGVKCHNILRIGDGNQLLAGTARVTAHDENSTVLDTTTLWGGKATSITRRFSLNCNGASIVDHIKGARTGEKVRFQLYTAAKVRLDGGTATLEKDGHFLRAANDCPEASWSLYDCASELRPFETPQDGRTVLAWEAVIPDNGELRVTTNIISEADSRESNGKQN